jgi:hypothetical protein
LTEVKTISVAEKGGAEIIFPLEFGGDLKLRLSFVLNEEEKEKIREMVLILKYFLSKYLSFFISFDRYVLNS